MTTASIQGKEANVADLGDGLVLRRATPADADALAAFNGEIHGGASGPDVYVAALTRDMLTRPHPTFRPEFFTIVEDTRTHQIVSSLNLIPQTWSYGGLPFGVGRIELVGTHPDYRRRGLVRRQFEVVHRWSAELGHLMQGITGIPWYYRQFGYEMAITLDDGRALPPTQAPALADGATEPFRLRPATAADVPLITELDARGRERWLVSCVRDAAAWRYELDGRTEQNAERQLVLVIETNEAAARPVGMLAHNPWLWRGALGVGAYELTPEESWLAVTPSVLRALRAIGQRYAAEETIGVPAPGPDSFTRIVFRFDDAHPVYKVLPADAAANPAPYAWYVRVPDLPTFICHVAPVLGRRLAASAAANYTGELCLSFYRDGLRLGFEQGRLVAAGPWTPSDDGDAPDAGFPPLTFLQLLFGYRSLAELRHAFPDCRANPEAAVVLDALFPRLPSHVWPVA